MNELERITILESEMVKLKIDNEVNKMAIGELKTTVKEIKGNTSKIVWLVGSALVLAIVQFILKGGLV